MTPRPGAATVLAVAILLGACGAGSPPAAPAGASAAEAPLLTLVDYLGQGEARALRFLETGAGDEGKRLAAAVASARRSTVRIRVHHDRTASSYSTDHGSGFLLEGGTRVLTAGHVLEVFGRDEKAELVVVCSDGTVLHAKPLRREFSGKAGVGPDFGILEIDAGSKAPAGTGLPTGPVKPGALVAILGFPGRLGRGASGAVTGDDIVKNGPLDPLCLVARVTDEKEMILEPVAGCVPEGGMSGGPVVDAEGRVVGIEHSVSRTEGGSAPTYTVNAFPLDGVLPGSLTGK